MLLGSRVVPALAAGAANAGSKDVTIPLTTGTGSYYVIAMRTQRRHSRNERNQQYLFASIMIGGDLVISALTLERWISCADVSDTTTNDGAGASAASVTRFYLSSNSSFDAGDTLLDGARSVPALDPGVSSVGPTTITIPASTPAGAYYVIAKADADGAVSETTETNNTLGRAISVGSDLVVSSLVPSKGCAGHVNMTDTTSTTATARSGPITSLYLSPNSTWTPQTCCPRAHRARSSEALRRRADDVTIPAGPVQVVRRYRESGCRQGRS